jgi:hypothetical protein
LQDWNRDHEERAMSSVTRSASASDARNAALLEAEVRRAEAVREAEVEYTETVGKLRERYDADLAEAAARRLRAVTPAHQAYNRAVIAAEHLDGQFAG